MMKNFDQSAKINHYPNCPYIRDHPSQMLINGGSGSGKTNALLNLINQRPDVAILTKLIYTSKIHSSQNINCLLTEEKK